MYRNWHTRAMKKTWFKGYIMVDIEDLETAELQCNGVKTGNFPQTTNGTAMYYDENVPPNQKGVDNRAYLQKVWPQQKKGFIPEISLDGREIGCCCGHVILVHVKRRLKENNNVNALCVKKYSIE
jgi:hypothetical protein